MVTTVKLQEVMQYSWWVILIAVVLSVIAIAVLTYVFIAVFKIFRKIPPRPKALKIKMSPYVLNRIKAHYSARIQDLQMKYAQGAVTKRDGYQKLSIIIRGFVHEATGINVESLTASEVKKLGIRNLDKLMEEYYVPEFAEDYKSIEKDLSKSCNTAMGVIRTWS